MDRTEEYEESGGFPEFSFVSTSEEAHRVIEEYEIRTTSRFSCYVAKKGFGCTDFYDDSKKLKVMWEDFQDNNKSPDMKAWRLEFDGIPYLSLSWKKFDCHHGLDRKVPLKEKRKKPVPTEGKKRNQGSSTKKLGCPARIILREVIKFPEFMISQDTHWYRHEASRKVRSAIKAKTPVGERRIYIYLPRTNDHRQHLTGAAGGITQRLDSRIKHKIQQLNAEGQSNVDDIRTKLRHFVENELFCGSEPPPVTSRRFYPTKTDIRNHLYLAKTRQEKMNTLTSGNSKTNVSGSTGISSAASPRINRLSRKRKMKETASSEDLSSISVFPDEQSPSMSLLVPCPDHITEVEISSQETMNATDAIQDKNSIEETEDCTSFVANTVEVPQTFNVVIREAESCADVPSALDDTAKMKTRNVNELEQIQAVPESRVKTGSLKSSNQSGQDQESSPVEQQCEVNDITVIENLNLIAQAMETRMLESSLVQTRNQSEQSLLSSNLTADDVPMVTKRTSNNGANNDDTIYFGDQCKNLVSKVQHLTELVQETSVLETVQNKLLDLVSFLESNIPQTSEHCEQNTSENEHEQIVEKQSIECSSGVVKVQKVQPGIVSFELVL